MIPKLRPSLQTLVTTVLSFQEFITQGFIPPHFKYPVTHISYVTGATGAWGKAGGVLP